MPSGIHPTSGASLDLGPCQPTRPLFCLELPMMLTRRQGDLLRYLAEYWMRYGYSPNYDEMAEAMGVGSKGAIHRLIGCLVERGHIKRVPYVARGIHIIQWPREPAGTIAYWKFDRRDKGLI